MIPLLALLACHGASAGEEEGWDGAEESEDAVGQVAVFSASCEEAKTDGVEVPGISGPIVYVAETCSASYCVTAEGVRRDDDVLYVTCRDGYDSVRVVAIH